MESNESDVWSDLSKRFSKNLIDPVKHDSLLLKNRHSCCQLVAAINAMTILTGQMTLTEDEIEELVDLVVCRNGGALNIEAAFPIIGLKVTEYEGGIPPFAWFHENMPVSFAHHDPRYGFHCSLIVGTYYEPAGKTSLQPREHGFCTRGGTYPSMSWAMFCNELPFHEHQLCFRKYEIDE